jgi:hypothetical protein
MGIVTRAGRAFEHLRQSRDGERICVRCFTPIVGGQLYMAHLVGPVHVACPTDRQIAHAERMGRTP